MRFVKQKFRHAPESGIYGDCARTAIACLLGIDPETVPHWHCALEPGEQERRHNDFLAERGLIRFTLAFAFQEVEAMLDTAARLAQGQPYLLAGQSRNGTCHVVVCQGQEIVWDPALDDSGIVGPHEGHFWIDLIVRPLCEAAHA